MYTIYIGVDWRRISIETKEQRIRYSGKRYEFEISVGSVSLYSLGDFIVVYNLQPNKKKI